MSSVRRVYVEKKPAFAVQAKDLRHELRKYLGVSGLTGVRVLIRYDVENISDDVFEKACKTVFAEPPVDVLYREEFETAPDASVFGVEFLPGQFDQRADSAVQCVQFLNAAERTGDPYCNGLCDRRKCDGRRVVCYQILLHQPGGFQRDRHGETGDTGDCI